MASYAHRPHPIDGEPERMLYDDCEACDENARWPLGSLDQAHLSFLWDEMRRVEFSPAGSRSYRTSPEARAARHLYWAAVLFARLEILPPGWRQEGLIPEGGEVIVDNTK